jgi:hypothetical protein
MLNKVEASSVRPCAPLLTDRLLPGQQGTVQNATVKVTTRAWFPRTSSFEHLGPAAASRTPTHIQQQQLASDQVCWQHARLSILTASHLHEAL